MTESDLFAVPGYPGYFARTDGKIFRKNWKGAIEELRPYHVVPVKTSKKKTTMKSVHQLVAMATIGPAPAGKTLVRHLDGDPSHNAKENLAWGNHLENLQDSISHGTAAFMRGANHRNSKLDEVKVRLIKDLLSEGFPKREIARKFGISPKTMRDIDQGVTWGHVN